MAILTTQFNDLVRNAQITWREGFDMVPEAARQLYDIINDPKAVTDYSSIDNPGFERRKDQGGAYTIGNPRQGYSMTLTKSRIGLMQSITWEMRQYDKYREIEKRMRFLCESTAMRIELDLTHLFTFGLQASSYTNMDGETISTTTGDAVQIF